MRHLHAAVVLLALVGIVHAVPTWHPPRFNFVGDGVNAKSFTASPYTTGSLSGIAQNTIYRFRVSASHDSGLLSSSTTFGMLVSGNFYPLVGPIAPTDGPYTSGTKTLTATVEVHVDATDVIGQTIDLGLQGRIDSWADSGRFATFNGPIYLISKMSVPGASGSGTFTMAPAIIFDSVALNQTTEYMHLW